MDFFEGGPSSFHGYTGNEYTVAYNGEFEDEAGVASASRSRSTVLPPLLVPPYSYWGGDYSADYEPVNTNIQLPPLQQNFTFPPDPPYHDFPSPSLRPDVFGAPSPATTSPSHDPFIISASSDLPAGPSSIPTVAGPSTFASSSFTSEAPRADSNTTSLYAQPSLPSLRSPAIPSEPSRQLPMPSAAGDSDQVFLDYLLQRSAAELLDTIQDTDGSYAVDDDFSWSTLPPCDPYPAGADYLSTSPTNAAAIAQPQSSPTYAVGVDYETAFAPDTNMPSTSFASGSSRAHPNLKRPAPSPAGASSPVMKRRQTPRSTTPGGRARPLAGRRRPSRSSASGRGSVEETKASFVDDDDDEDDVQIIDLSNTDKVPEEIMKPAVDNSVKLSGYECIICMDRCSDITVTHCGHLFCGNCLHQSINISDKKICPICRQKLDIRPSNGRQPTRNAKTYFHLELKLMPKNRQGKLPATR